MKRIGLFSWVLLAALILAACGSASSNDKLSGGAGAPMEMPAPMMDAARPQETAKQASSEGGAAAPTSVERMVLKNAQVSIVVADVEARMKQIELMAQRMGGYVVSSNLYQSYAAENVYVPEGQVTIRVPAEQLDAALEEIKKDAAEVKSESVSGEDVTAQYVDLQSRLKNLEAAEAQLEEIMKQATTTEDVINVFNQITYYREQIELVKGQMKYYEESAALSSVTVQIIAAEKEKPLEIGGWRLSGTAREAAQDLVYFYQGFTRFLIRFFIFILPTLVTIAIPFYLGFLAVRGFFRWARGTKKKEAPKPPVEEKK